MVLLDVLYKASARENREREREREAVLACSTPEKQPSNGVTNSGIKLRKVSPVRCSKVPRVRCVTLSLSLAAPLMKLAEAVLSTERIASLIYP